LFLTLLQFHTSILQVSIPLLLPASIGAETAEKSKLPPKSETSFEEEYVIYELTLQCKKIDQPKIDEPKIKAHCTYPENKKEEEMCQGSFSQL
jgi:hypothetical protein